MSHVTLINKAAVTWGLVSQHYRKWWPAWVTTITLAAWFQMNYKIEINLSPSLMGKVFLVHKGEHVKKGDYVAFQWHGDRYYPAGGDWIKIVKGVSGDEVTEVNRAFFVNGEPVGLAKSVALDGSKLELGPVGRIGEGKFFVMGTHKDSLDSRYANAGWIDQSKVIGRAYVVF